jgi:hypothetical protein
LSDDISDEEYLTDPRLAAAASAAINRGNGTNGHYPSFHMSESGYLSPELPDARNDSYSKGDDGYFSDEEWTGSNWLEGDAEDEDWPDSLNQFESRWEARMNTGYDRPNLAVADRGDYGSRRNGSRASKSSTPAKTSKKTSRYSGLKKMTRKQIEQDMPPAPRGCEWRRSDDGWNLWKYWTEMDVASGDRIKKTRYAGYLSHDAWQILKKEYDNEAFIATVGERLRRHSGR